MTGSTTVTETAADAPTVEGLQTQLRAEQDHNLLLTESVADLQLALEDKGWARLNADVRDEFTTEGRRALSSVCRTMAIANPLIKRGLMLRTAYVWGQSVQVTATATGDDGQQDVAGVVADFWEANAASLTGTTATEELERALGTDGEVFLAAFTSPLAGKVRVRSIPAAEVTRVITNPEDRDEPWFYIREYVQPALEAGYATGNTRVRGRVVKVAHPALSYTPATKLKMVDGAQVRWDAPILHVPVNRLDGWLRGVPDVYAAVAWARAYKDFLTDWALLTKSLAKFAWRMSGDSRAKAQGMARRARSEVAAAGGAAGVPPIGAGNGAAGAGSTAVTGPGQSLEAVPKSGAHIDADSGRPLAAMVAAGLGVPVTMLLSDPGVTGARATAETLDKPTILEAGMRRMLWQAKLTELLDYVIDQAVIAPRGPLRGGVRIDDWGRRVVSLTAETPRTVEWTWPALTDLDPVQMAAALVSALDSEDVPPEPLVRMLLQVLGIRNVDDVMKTLVDENGDWVGPASTAGDAATQAYRRGENPAAVA